MIFNTNMMLKFILALLLPAMIHHNDTSMTAMEVKKVRTIYLTFEGGPQPASEEISSLITNEQIRANVFLVGSNLWIYSKSTRNYYLYKDNPYIECGNRGFMDTRDDEKYYKQPDYILYDFALNDYYFNFSNLICRLPHKNSWRISARSYDESESAKAAADLLASYECRIFGWDLEWTPNKRGSLNESPDQIVALINKLFEENKTFTHDHLVLKCEERSFRNGNNEDKLKTLIEKLKSQGIYRFEYLSNYPDYVITAHSDSIIH